MNITLMLPLVCIFAADILFFTTIRNNKLDFKGTNEYRFVIPAIVILFIASLFAGKDFSAENILLTIGLIIFMLLGNKSGVGKKGILTGSWFTSWRKIDDVYVEIQGEKCILFYSNKNIKRRLIFKKEDENQLKDYIEKIKREKGIKK
ncbi:MULTISPECIES: DUF5673 domain-containing protein [unclassified Clostridium]|uniref:DUF5673 domain-containing protein n=1 Tax=unclassified Clostridium TaxID=2614128 RepID=UPI000297DB8A|nr:MULTISPECIES: DUF5673 domain-containing protein [unclassified Clostridium]EKQ56351.1 MAG: hypothetical protein A370_02107 [Clostridium sp. Maddingley MBC34-26]